jgi:hypothetical protein
LGDAMAWIEKLASIQSQVESWTHWCYNTLDPNIKWDKSLLDQSAENIDCLLTVTDGLFDFLAVAMRDKWVEFQYVASSFTYTG